MRSPFLVAITALVLLGVLGAGAPLPAAAPKAITLDVDAHEAGRRLFHARETLPVTAGPLTLVYPQWLPGEHAPTGPIADLAGLKFSANGKPVAWERDAVDMYAFHVDVPKGATTLTVELDFLSSADASGFSSAASADAALAVVSWNQLLLYPAKTNSDDLTFAASLRVPTGWKYGTSLAVAKEAGDTLTFKPVSLTTLVDSPVLCGARVKVVTLAKDPPVRMFVAADGDAALDMEPELVKHYERLVAEADALFGARHYRAYTFLVTLSDQVALFGLEHHESSDNRMEEEAFVDEDTRRLEAELLPHELTHSWNGKFRRPAGLAPGHFDEPMHGELLWVYEGLTQYLGEVLTARSGLWTNEEYLDDLAITAAKMDSVKGRAWRPLADTAIAAQVLYGSADGWRAWRRGTDFYPEGSLLWLEVDTIIRRETKGAKSLDDFCRLFHGAQGKEGKGQAAAPSVLTYTFDDIVAALDQVAPYDWKKFLTTRLQSTDAGAPLGGIIASGWKLVYTEEVSQQEKSIEAIEEMTSARYSLGIEVKEDGSIPDVVPGSPSDKAGIGPGMRVIAVNGRRYSGKRLRDAVRATKTKKQKLQLLIESGDVFETYKLDYAGGERHPHLVRDDAKADLLTAIIAPLAATK